MEQQIAPIGAARMRRLCRLASSLVLATDLNEVQVLAGAAVQELLNADYTLLLLADDGREHIVEFDHAGAIVSADVLALLYPYAHRALDGWRPTLVANLAGADGAVAPELAKDGWARLLVFPFPPSMPVGVVAALWRAVGGESWLQQKVMTARYIGEMVRAAISNIKQRGNLEYEVAARTAEIAEVTQEHSKELQRRNQLEEEIKRSAITDVLTGLLNRRGFFLHAEQSLKMARRRQLQSAMLFVDINNLKAVNDVHGHVVGDRLIQDAAEVLCRSFRETDVLARLGGDEFAAFTVDAEQPQVILDRIGRNAELFQKQKQLPYKISFSSGIVLCDPAAELSVVDYLALADMQMYAQKNQSRQVLNGPLECGNSAGGGDPPAAH